jgi:hypothetical protein
MHVRKRFYSSDLKNWGSCSDVPLVCVWLHSSQMHSLVILHPPSGLHVHLLPVPSCIALSYGLVDRGFESLRGLRIFLSITASKPSLGSHSLLFNGSQGLFPWELSGRGVKLTTRSRMRGSVPHFPQYIFMAWCSVKAQGQLYLYLYWSEVWAQPRSNLWNVGI